jgi:hypothetical protein
MEEGFVEYRQFPPQPYDTRTCTFVAFHSPFSQLVVLTPNKGFSTAPIISLRLTSNFPMPSKKLKNFYVAVKALFRGAEPRL